MVLAARAVSTSTAAAKALHFARPASLTAVPSHRLHYSISKYSSPVQRSCTAIMASEDNNKVSTLDGAAPESTDFANYFCTYAYLYHQKEMLEDHKRTGAYYSAVMSNRRQFQGKVVLDVGTGSGILSIFAAKAGAKKVYAVEATNMAQHARRLVAHNKLGDVIEVIQGTIESIELPEQVDIIISEWMGYFLLRESMLDSVLVARDKFLKPGGALYPSHASMYLVPIRSAVPQQRRNELHHSLEAWNDFLTEMKSFYQVDLDVLSSDFAKEQQEYLMSTSQWTDTHPQQMLGSPSCFKRYDLHKVTLEELKAPLKADFKLNVADGGPVDALCGWFDVNFLGSEQNPTDNDVKLSTCPDPTGATHWGQQTFYIYPPIDCSPGDSIATQLSLTRRTDNHRLLKLEVALKVEGTSVHAESNTGARDMWWNIE